MTGERSYKKRGARGVAFRLYARHVRPRLSSDLQRQRVRLAWHVWGYWRLLLPSALPPRTRAVLVGRFLRVDWSMVHAHKPTEIARIGRRLAGRRGRPGEVVVEAGCWTGGSTAKLSLLCRELGLELEVYDSFQGVEAVPVAAGDTDFGGRYAAGEELVRANVEALGALEVCRFHPGWFADTLAHGVGRPVRLAYVDCDIVKGTVEAMEGVLPELVDDGLVYSQDFHIRPVRAWLEDPESWRRVGLRSARLVPEAWNLVRIEPVRA